MTACIEKCGCPLGNCLCHTRVVNEQQDIHTVTTVHIEYEPLMDELIIVRFRCVGYFFDLKEAIDCVLKNWGDIYENGHYNHAVIESVSPGIYSYPRGELWHVWRKGDKPGYQLINKPEGLRRTVGFGIG